MKRQLIMFLLLISVKVVVFQPCPTVHLNLYVWPLHRSQIPEKATHQIELTAKSGSLVWVFCLTATNQLQKGNKTYSVWNLHYFFPLLHRESDGSEKCIIQLATGETQMKPSNCQFSSRAKKQNVTEPASNLINALVWLHPFYWDNGKWC